MIKKQIKSKERVANHGEVFTAEREVNAMLDLVKHETERIDSRFLEPACGDGNFLAEILRRKLVVVRKKYSKSPADYERYAVLAASSVYGVDILLDNAIACRERLFLIWDADYKLVCKNETNEDCRSAVKYIFNRNIVCGNALSLLCVDNNGADTDEPIIFSEWSFISETLIKRRDFRFDVLLKENNDKEMYDQLTLFSSDPSGFQCWGIDSVTKEIIPKPIREYPPINYRRVQDNG